MSEDERRADGRPDRRRVARGGRRGHDRSGRHPIVLVAESYAAARSPYVRYLDRFNFHVEQASDGEQALALINTTPPHVILVERDLPLLSAGRLSQWLAQNWRTRHIPIIVLAGSIPLPPGSEPPTEGMAGVLIKPFQLTQMLEEIRRVLRVQPSA